MPNRAPRLCPQCGRLYQPPRCPTCTRNRDQTRGTGWQRYNANHRARRTQMLNDGRTCERPDGCPHPDAGTPTNPLTRDHLTPGNHHDDNGTEPDRILCRRCNSSRRDGRW